MNVRGERATYNAFNISTLMEGMITFSGTFFLANLDWANATTGNSVSIDVWPFMAASGRWIPRLIASGIMRKSTTVPVEPFTRTPSPMFYSQGG